MSVGKRKTSNARTLQQPLQPAPTAHIVNAPAKHSQPQTASRPGKAAADLRRAARIAEHLRVEAEACAKLAALPVQLSKQICRALTYGRTGQDEIDTQNRVSRKKLLRGQFLDSCRQWNPSLSLKSSNPVASCFRFVFAKQSGQQDGY
jgi:hypothetical protein